MGKIMMKDDMKIITQNVRVRQNILRTRRTGIEECLNLWATKIPGDYEFRLIDTHFYDESLMYINRTLSEYREYLNG